MFVEITNSWTKGNNYSCIATPGRETVLVSDIIQQMTDNLDGTYTYNYSVSRPGQITVSVLQYTQGGVYQEFFPNSGRTGDNQLNGTTSQINFNYGQGDIYPGHPDGVSIGFYFIFKAPITGSVTFELFVDDRGTMSVSKYFNIYF